MTARIAIIGAGPAGLSCALWLSNHGYTPLLLENSHHAGGMLRFNHHANDWLLGFSGETGTSIGEKFIRHIDKNGIIVHAGVNIHALEQTTSGFILETRGKMHPEQVDYLVVATGTRPRASIGLIQLAEKHPDRVFLGAGQLWVENFTAGQKVALFGGGDNAFENAYQLAKRGVEVAVYHRGVARARREWLDRCHAEPTLRIFPHSDVRDFYVEENAVCFNSNGNTVHAQAIAVMYGYEPNTDRLSRLAPWLRPILDEKGFIKVNDYQKTAIDRVYAIGDVTTRPLPCLPSAIGQGSVAAKAIVLDAERCTR